MLIFQTLSKLRDYKPKDDMFTSQEEMDYIASVLDLNNISNDDLVNVRDCCVMMWCEFTDAKRAKGEDYWDIHNAMMSITSVIDHYKYKRGLAV